MQHFAQQFNDKCYELQLLRWFRNNFVSEEDIHIITKQHQSLLMQLINFLTIMLFIHKFILTL